MRRDAIMAALAAVSLLFLAPVQGQSSEEPITSKKSPHPEKNVAATAEKNGAHTRGAGKRAIDDPGIATAVEMQLIVDPGVDASYMEATAIDGVVTLTGSSKDLLSKERATRVAETVRGVRAVINRVSVAAPDRPDAELARDAREALLYDPVADSYEIDVEVEDGKATLTGKVESWVESDFAERMVKGVRGIRDVKNKIEIRYGQDRLDSEIDAEVEQRLLWDRYVDGGALDVEVADGKVTLTGKVSSAAEKRRARSRAFVTGVHAVDASGVQVDPRMKDETRDDPYATSTPADIVKAVNAAFLYDPRISSYAVDVAASGGMVTLSGEVRDLRAKRAAADVARSVVGVYFVRNHLKVRSPGKTDDERIARLVRDNLRRDPYVASYDVRTEVEDGVVTLTGMVETTFEKMQAESVAAAVDDVADVKNKLAVDYDLGVVTYDPHVYDWSYQDYDWYEPLPNTTVKSDWRIRRDIEDELFWSPFVDEDEVNVSVDDGTATLTGTVDDWGEYRAARENAFEGGAVKVRNRLDISGGIDLPF